MLVTNFILYFLNEFLWIHRIEHTAPITGVEFSPKGQVVVSASLDGTVRAFDLIRYRNFRILTSPDPNVQFRYLLS
jgi:periodic tryptophan protein 2